MSFAGLLGAGLLGGVANAAKGVGDKLREEAKQKRAMALVNQEQANALALQEAVAEDNIDQATAEGKIQIDIGDAGSVNNVTEIKASGEVQSDLLAEKGDIDAAAAVVTQANNIKNLNAQGDIAKDLAKLKSELDKGEAADKAKLDQLRVKLEGSIAARAASQLAIVNADAASTAAVVDSDAAAAAAVVQTDLQNDQQTFTSGENDKDRNQQLELQRTKYKAELLKIKATKVGEIKDFYDETTGRIQPHERMVDGSWEPRGGDKAADASTSKGLTLQVSYNDKGEEVKGYMNGTDFVQVGGAKAVKAGTKKEALAYFTGQAKYILGGAQNSFMAAKLTDDDTKLMREWIPEAEAAFKANPNMSLSQIVKNIMFKPWVLDDADITDADITAGEAEASAAGSNALDSIEYARQISTRRQPDFVKAQTAYDNIMGPQGNKNTDVLFKRMKKMGYNPDFLIK